MAAWANFSGGLLGRTPDYFNASIAAMAAAHEFFAASDPRFGDNIAELLPEARKHDWCATHTLVNPRASRARDGREIPTRNWRCGWSRKPQPASWSADARMLATLAPISEELLVFPSTVLKAERRRGAFRARIRDQLQCEAA